MFMLSLGLIAGAALMLAATAIDRHARNLPAEPVLTVAGLPDLAARLEDWRSVGVRIITPRPPARHVLRTRRPFVKAF